MSPINEKNAVEFLNLASPEFKKPRKTFICIGVARGGTSAVAGTMNCLGVFMGDKLENNYEDPAFSRVSIDDMKAVITRRNAEHGIWGWKNPQAAAHLENLLPKIENPHLVVVFRDLVATMKAHMRWHKRSQVFAVHDIMMQQQRNWYLIERWKVPTAMVSYEKAMLAPELFIDDMARFLSVPAPTGKARNEMTAFLEPGRYK